MFALIKHLHVWLVLLSIGGFFVRLTWLLGNSQKLELKAVKVAPHIIDTLLLITGVILAIFLQLSPLEYSWFSVKLISVITYIALGMIAFKAKSKFCRAFFGFSALLIACGIIILAASKPF